MRNEQLSRLSGARRDERRQALVRPAHHGHALLLRWALLCCLTAWVPVGSSQGIPIAKDTRFPGLITLSVDLSDAARKIFQVHERIPVVPGPLTLLYPE